MGPGGPPRPSDEVRVLRPLASLLRSLALLSLVGCSTPLALGRIALDNVVTTFAPIRPAPRHAASPRRRNTRLAVTWLGHATTLVQLDDKLVLTDPLLSSTAGYLSKRLVAPGLTARELPALDAVVVSHMHFDHLSFDSLFALRDKIPALLLPGGGRAYVPDYGFPQVELETWQSWERDGLRITAVPARHVGWRYGLDRLWNPRSFTGYVFEYHGLSVYFAGDTALELEELAEVRRRFPHLDLALVPIAPLEPRAFMSHTHVDPDEALQCFLAVGAARMVPIHYDTFINSFDRPGEALPALERARLARGLPSERVLPLEIGEQRVLLAR
jgi:L-ascorbate metabolism protein UlaG (beta-lactamase superfamily)